MGKNTYSTNDKGRVTVSEKTGRVDVYVGDCGSSEHCHLYVDTSTGDSGTVHRGGCDECKDPAK